MLVWYIPLTLTDKSPHGFIYSLNSKGGVNMLNLTRIAGLVALMFMAAACVPQQSIKQAAEKVESEWKTENTQIISKEGKRTFTATKRQGFEAAQLAANRLGLVIENQTYETGFIYMAAPAPTPLSKAEWEKVQKTETREMRDLVSQDLGFYQWWVTLDPSGKEVLTNVFITETKEGIDVTIGLRLRVKDSSSDKLKRMQPPPTALRMGLAKFWAAYEMELDNLTGGSYQPARKIAKIPVAIPPKSSTAIRPPSPSSNPDAVAVIIGNRNYSGMVPPVEYAHRDADAWKQFALETLGISDKNIIYIQDATLLEMQSVLGNDRSHTGKLWRWIRPQESDLFVFYSGHGVPGMKDRRAYLLPVGSNPDIAEIQGYPLELLYKNLSKMEARTTTVFIDACFSGQSPGGALVRNASGIRVTTKTPPAASLTIITAAREEQVASWDRESEHGLFTWHLLHALNGAADQQRYGKADGRITLNEVRKYLDREMSYAARRNYGRTQQAMVFGDPERILVSLEKK